MNFNIADVLAAVFVLTVVYVLVRPQSKAADAVALFFDAVASMVNAATRS